MRSVMTCDKHTGGYYSSPCSHCFTTIDPVGRSLSEPIQYSQDKALSMLIGLHRERENTNRTRWFHREGNLCAHLLPSNSNTNKNRILLHFLSYA